MSFPTTIAPRLSSPGTISLPAPPSFYEKRPHAGSITLPKAQECAAKISCLIQERILPEDIECSPKQALQKIKDGLKRAKTSQNRCIALFATRSYGFIVGSYPLSEIDADFYAAQAFTQKRLERLYQRVQDESLHNKIYRLLHLHTADLPRDLLSHLYAIAQRAHHAATLFIAGSRKDQASRVPASIKLLFRGFDVAFKLQMDQYQRDKDIEMIPVALERKGMICHYQATRHLFEYMEKIQKVLVRQNDPFPYLSKSLYGIKDTFPHILLYTIPQSEKANPQQIMLRDTLSLVDPSLPKKFPLYHEIIKELKKEYSYLQTSEKAILLLKNTSYLCLSDIIRLPFIQKSDAPIKKLISLLSHCSHITHLKVGVIGSTQESLQEAYSILEKLPNITTLGLSGTDSTDELLLHIPLKNITKLICDDTQITGSFLSSKKFQKLQSLSINGCEHLSESDLSHISATSLRELSCARTHVFGTFLALEAFQDLISLNISSCTSILEETLKTISARKLQVLRCNSTSITGVCLWKKAFQHLHTLEIFLDACLSKTNI